MNQNKNTPNKQEVLPKMERKIDEKKRNQPLIKIVITLLTLIVLILIGIPFSKYFLIATHTQETKTIIHNKMPGIIPKTEKIEAPNLATLMGQAPQAVNQKISGENAYAIGQVVIPTVSINQPIFIGLTNENLVHGTVDLFPNRQPDKNTLTIIGHHVFYYGGYQLLFGGIQNLKKEEPVYVRYFNQYYEYKVSSNVIIKETDVDKLVDIGPDYLYLMTCNQTLKTPYRVLITAKKVSVNEMKLKETFQESSKVLTNKSQKNYLIWFIMPIIILIFIISIFLFYVWKI